MVSKLCSLVTSIYVANSTFSYSSQFDPTTSYLVGTWHWALTNLQQGERCSTLLPQSLPMCCRKCQWSDRSVYLTRSRTFFWTTPQDVVSPISYCSIQAGEFWWAYYNRIKTKHLPPCSSNRSCGLWSRYPEAARCTPISIHRLWWARYYERFRCVRVASCRFRVSDLKFPCARDKGPLGTVFDERVGVASG